MKSNPRILVSGSSGLIGKDLCDFLEKKQYDVVRLKRGISSKTPGVIYWDPKKKNANLEDFESFDGVVHLAGESLMKGLWTKKKKQRLLESREKDTQFLVALLEKTRNPPKVFISASGIGYYGSQTGPITETTVPGSGFLSDVCKAWELASTPLLTKKVRVVHARLSPVLSKKGGLLKKILPFFKLGLGATIGKGDLFFPWISLEDAVRGLEYCLKTNQIQGAVNFVSPIQVSQKVFSKTLAKVVKRPCFLRIPKSVILGEKAKSLLLCSQEVIPDKLIRSGFSFFHQDLEEALRHELFQ